MANPPTVTAVTASTGDILGGQTRTITGTDFVNGATVTFGGSAATGVTFVDSTTLTCITPAHAAGAVNVVVTNPDSMTGTLTNGFTFAQFAPVVTSCSPSAGALAGATSVTITGSGFIAVSGVTFGGTAATSVVTVNTTTVTCVVPAHAAGAVNIVVTNNDAQTGTLTNGYTYQAAPTITKVTPSVTIAAGGETITGTGTGFVSGMTMTVGGTSVTPTILTSTSFTFTAPAKSNGRHDIVVTNADTQSATLTNGLMYVTSGLWVRVPWNGSLWADISGNGRSMSSANNPDVGTSINGRGAVADFIPANSDNINANPATMADVITTSAYTVIAVVFVDNIATNNATLVSNDPCWVSSGGPLGQYLKSATPTYHIRHLTVSITEAADSMTCATGAWQVLAGIYDGSKLYASVNGALGSGTAALNVHSSVLANSVKFGINSGRFDGKLAEGLWLKYALTAAELTHYVNYCRDYYGQSF